VRRVRWLAVALLALALAIAVAPAAFSGAGALSCSTAGCASAPVPGSPAGNHATPTKTPTTSCLDQAECGGGAALGAGGPSGLALVLIAVSGVVLLALAAGLGRVLLPRASLRRGVPLSLSHPPQPVGI
jgi:hypothetical protein